MKAAHFLSLSLLPALLAVAGCGNDLVTNEDSGDPIFRVQGKLLSDGSLDLPDTLHVAVVWVQEGRQAVTYVSQEVEVATFSFPATFSIGLTELPPEGAMMSWRELEGRDVGTDGRFAVGMVVVYEDQDGDGRLSLPSLTTVDLPDRILGLSSPDEGGAFVLYVEGPAPALDTHTEFADEFGVPPPLGFSVVGENPDHAGPYDVLVAEEQQCELDRPDEYEDCWEAFDAGVETLEATVPVGRIFDEGEMLSVTIEENPNAEEFCPYSEDSGDFSDGEGDWDGYPGPPEGAEVICSEDGLSYDFTYEHPDTDPSLCGNNESTWSGGNSIAGIPSGVPFPEWWPCPVG